MAGGGRVRTGREGRRRAQSAWPMSSSMSCPARAVRARPPLPPCPSHCLLAPLLSPEFPTCGSMRPRRVFVHSWLAPPGLRAALTQGLATRLLNCRGPRPRLASALRIARGAHRRRFAILGAVGPPRRRSLRPVAWGQVAPCFAGDAFIFTEHLTRALPCPLSHSSALAFVCRGLVMVCADRRRYASVARSGQGAAHDLPEVRPARHGGAAHARQQLRVL